MPPASPAVARQVDQPIKHGAAARRPFICEVPGCGAAFGLRCNLAHHFRAVHLGARPFRCDEEGCDKRFSQRCNLVHHVRAVHHGERPYVCTELGCKRAFAGRYHLFQHVRAVHRGERPYVCTEAGCTRAFAQHGNLNQHVRTVHRGERPFPCTVNGCGKSFVERGRLIKHMSAYHGSTEPLPDRAPPRASKEGGVSPRSSVPIAHPCPAPTPASIGAIVCQELGTAPQRLSGGGGRAQQLLPPRLMSGPEQPAQPLCVQPPLERPPAHAHYNPPPVLIHLPPGVAHLPIAVQQPRMAELMSIGALLPPLVSVGAQIAPPMLPANASLPLRAMPASAGACAYVQVPASAYGVPVVATDWVSGRLQPGGEAPWHAAPCAPW